MAFESLLNFFTPRTTLLALLPLLFLFYTRRNDRNIARDRALFAEKHGCKPAAYPLPYAINYLFLWDIIKVARKAKIMDFFHQVCESGGRYGTAVQTSWIGFPQAVFTNDPENIKALLSTSFEDWAVRPARTPPTSALLGRGIFTTDGAFWSHSRALLRPNFEKRQTSELSQFESHMPGLFSSIRASSGGGEGKTFDLADTFQALTMDTSSEFLMGESTGVLAGLLEGQSEAKARKFVSDMDVAMTGIGSHVRLGPLWYLLPRWEERRATREARGFVDGFVERAWENAREARAKKGEVGGEADEERHGGAKRQYVFIDELAKQKEVDKDRIRDEVMNVFLAGRETTAALLSNLWFCLVRHPEAWEELKKEVDSLGGELPTYEGLRDMKFIKYCAQETLRLYPPVPILSKVALRSTYLPRGGGPDGSAPLFCPKNSAANYVMYSSMRSPSVWGDDASVWRPSRWADPSLRPGWNYLAFGGGARVCLGQQYALTETYYVTIRMVQEFGAKGGGFVNRDQEAEWKEKVQVTMCSANGVKVGLRT